MSSFWITGEQIRAARALARLEQSDLAQAAGLSLETIKRLERIRGPVAAHVRTLHALVRCFEGLGVQIDDEGGVRTIPDRPAPRRAAASADAGTGPPHRIIYRSVMELSRVGAMKATLADIERVSQAHNAEAGVTGVLAAGDGAFLGALEGPKLALQRLFGAICTDSRHSDVVVLENRHIVSRHFTDWTLCCGIFPSADQVLAGEPAMRDGFRPERLTLPSALGILTLFRDLQAQPPRIRRASILACPLNGECQDAICAAA